MEIRKELLFVYWMKMANDSLDVLNGYIHSNDVHYLTNKFLNNFWKFFIPIVASAFRYHGKKCLIRH